MDHASTAIAYDGLAERWVDGRFNSANGIGQHERALGFVQGGGWALNVGCGCSTRFNALMRGAGLQIEGIDISARMVALARAADPGVPVMQADVCEWLPGRSYRFISAWDSLWHVRLAQQRAVMGKLMAALEPGGVLIFSAGGLDAEDEHVDATMGPPLYYSTLGIAGLLDVVKEASCVCRHLEFDQHPEQHLYVIVQRPG